MANGIKTYSGAAPVQILLNPDLQFSLGVVVSNATSVTVGDRKIVKAGTPISGDLNARTTAFTVSVAGTATTCQGVLLHDVDVTDGAANGTLLIFGFVNTNRLDSATQALLISEVKAALNSKVIFIAA